MDNRMRKNKQVNRGSTELAIKVGFWYVISTFLTKGIAFITIPVFSRLLTKNDYGEFANYANWQSTLLIITGAELYNSLNRAYYDYKDDYNKYVSSVVILSTLLTIFVYALFLLNESWIFNIVKIPKQFIHIMFFTLMCSSCKALYLTREKTTYRYRSVVAVSVIDTVIPTLIAVALVVVSPENLRLSSRIYGFYLPSAVIGMGCALILIRQGKCFVLKHCAYALKLSIPLLFHYMTINLLNSTNTIIANNLGGAEIGAEVSMATSVIHLLTILFHAISGALTTWLMDNLIQEQYVKIKRDSFVYLSCLAIVSIGVILVAPEIIKILGGDIYISSVKLVPGLILAAFLQSITTIFTIILTFDKNVVKTAVVSAISAIISVSIKILFFSDYGVISLPITNITICFIMLVTNAFFVSQAGYRAVIPINAYVLAICAVIVFVLLSPILYDNFIIRYIIIFVGVLGCVSLLFMHKSQVKNLLKNKK